MKNLLDKFIKLIENFLVLLMIVMCAIIFIATFSRYTKLFIVPWAEELARYCMIWIVFWGIVVAAYRGEHFCVNALELFCPRWILNFVAILNTILVIASSTAISYYGILIIQKQMETGQVTPSLMWPMWIMQTSIPIGLMLMAIFYTINTFSKIKNRNREVE